MKERRGRKMSGIKLKPCPFWGSKAEIHKTSGGEYYVDCGLKNGFCHIIPRTWDYDTEEEAAEAWNRREDNETD